MREVFYVSQKKKLSKLRSIISHATNIFRKAPRKELVQAHLLPTITRLNMDCIQNDIKKKRHRKQKIPKIDLPVI
jgi:hypothetical protein